MPIITFTALIYYRQDITPPTSNGSIVTNGNTAVKGMGRENGSWNRRRGKYSA